MDVGKDKAFMLIEDNQIQHMIYTNDDRGPRDQATLYAFIEGSAASIQLYRIEPGAGPLEGCEVWDSLNDFYASFGVTAGEAIALSGESGTDEG